MTDNVISLDVYDFINKYKEEHGVLTKSEDMEGNIYTDKDIVICL